jgi:hypothetical protein
VFPVRSDLNLYILFRINSVKPEGGFLREVGFEYLHRSSASRRRRRKGNPVPGYNWAALFLGDVNTGTWPSRFGKSQV